MGFVGRVSAMIVVFVAAVVVLTPTAAHAEPDAGSVTGTFTDICGFVQADFSNADPDIPDAAFIRFSRNGKLLDPFGAQVNGGESITRYYVAADGDSFHYEWDVAGGLTESLDHVHVTPPGCDEPRLSVSLIDSCGPEFTIRISNTGTAPAEVVLNAPTKSNVSYTVAAGGEVRVTVPGVAISGASVGMHHPGPVEPDTIGLAIVDELQRAPGCGIPWPNDQIATFTATCTSVAVVLYALDMKGLLRIYRNGKVVRQQTVNLDIYIFAVPVKRNDIVTIDKPPLATYRHRPPGCASAVAPAATVPTALANIEAPPSVSPVIESPSPESTDPTTGAASGPPLIAEPAPGGVEPVALITTVGVVTAAVIFFAGWFIIGAARRRRQPVWAVAFGVVSPQPALRDVGPFPTTSVRWVARSGPSIYDLREDTAS